jgi:hypothetical protein
MPAIIVLLWVKLTQSLVDIPHTNIAFSSSATPIGSLLLLAHLYQKLVVAVAGGKNQMCRMML